MTPVAIRARVTGRVQGVAFRAWTQRQARALGLVGWVRNEADGSVTALIVGERGPVDELVAALHEGPALARVAAVRTETVHLDAPPGDFLITG